MAVVLAQDLRSNVVGRSNQISEALSVLEEHTWEMRSMTSQQICYCYTTMI